MKFFYDLPLRKKLVTIIGISSGLALLIIIFGMLIYETKTFRPRVLKQVSAIADLYSYTMAAPLLFQDSKAAQENLSTLKAIPEISMACLYTSKNGEFSKYIKEKDATGSCPEILKSRLKYEFEKSYLHYFQEINFDKNVIGLFYIQYHIPPLVPRLLQYILLLIVVSSALAMVSILITSGLQRFVNSPILKLADTAHLISQKNEFHHRVDYKSRDEVGTLTEAFNGMLDAIELSFSQNRATLEATADGILVVDHKGLIVEYNQKFLEMFRIPTSILDDRKDNTAIKFAVDELKNPEEFVRRINQIYSMPERESKDLLEFKDGRYIERYSHPQMIGKKIVGRVWSFRDITSQYESEVALRNSESRFRRVFDSNMIGIMFCNLNGWITEANDYYLNMIGYSREDLNNGLLNYKHLTPPEFEFLDTKAIEELKRTGVCEAYEKEYIRKDGSRVPILLGAAFLETSCSETVSFFLDMSERKRAEKEINLSLQQEMKARQDAEKALQVREDFMSIAAHELRTPLTPLKLQNDTLKRFFERRNDPELAGLKRTFHVTEQQIDRLIHLVDDLLDVTRIRTGRLSLNLESVNLSELVQDILGRYQETLSKNKIHVKLRLTPDIYGHWDKVRLEQVVMNLLTNAIKYGNGSEIHISTEAERFFAKLQVQDFGVGIDDEDKERIFNRFERASSIQHHGGFGLGLYISKQIIQAHQGRISVESSKGHGSKFIVELPLVPGKTS